MAIDETSRQLTPRGPSRNSGNKGPSLDNLGASTLYVVKTHTQLEDTGVSDRKEQTGTKRRKSGEDEIEQFNQGSSLAKQNILISNLEKDQETTDKSNQQTVVEHSQNDTQDLNLQTLTSLDFLKP